MKSINKILVLCFLIQLSPALSANDKIITPAQNAIKELGGGCAYLEVAQDECVIAYFSEVSGNWELSAVPADIYRVLHGKDKDGLWVISDFYSNGQRQASDLHTSSASALRTGTHSTDFKSPLRRVERWSRMGNKLEDLFEINGLANGKALLFSESGMLRTQGIFKNDKRIGVWKTWNEFDKSVVEQATYKKDGTSFLQGWYENKGGRRYQGSMLNAKQQGLWQLWHSNGKKAARGFCANGNAKGEWSFWNVNGQKVKDYKTWADNEATGLFVWACQ